MVNNGHEGNQLMPKFDYDLYKNHLTAKNQRFLGHRP